MFNLDTLERQQSHLVRRVYAKGIRCARVETEDMKPNNPENCSKEASGLP